MIVNTVVPPETPSPSELADPGQDEFAVAGRIGPDEQTDQPREEYSAKVDLKLHLENGGSIVDLAQVGPDFCILPSDHGHIITASTRGMLHVCIDSECTATPIELTTDVDFATDRFNYRKIDSVPSVSSVVETSLPAPEASTTEAQSGTEQTTTPAVSDTTAVATTEQTGLSKAEQERLFWEEVRLLGALRESESERDVVETELITARGRQKELQAELNNLSIKIPQLEQDLEDCCENTLRAAKQLWRLKQPGSDQEPQPAAIEPPPASEQPALPAPVEESTEWRNLATAELLAGITGLGKKKLDGICELAPTVGHLEDLRGEGSKQFKQFHEMLPKGCGQGIASMIEDRLTLHVRKHSPNATGGNPLADELLQAFRQKVASESWQATDCVPDAHDTEQTHLGYAAFNEGKPHSALPTQNPELARQWMLGWVCAEVVKHDVGRPSQAVRDPEDDTSTDESTANEGRPTEAEPATDTKPKKLRKPRASTKKSK
jgi:hypothetical protein